MTYREEIIGDCRLILGDCRDVLPTLGPVDAVVTDPPYGIGAANGASGGGTDASGRYKRRPKSYEGTWDNDRPDGATFALILAAAPLHVIWGGNYFADLLPRAGRWLFWDKVNSMPTYSDGEMAWTSLGGAAVKKFTRCNNGLASLRDGERVHPTQKPVPLMEWCFGFLPDRCSVLDPYMGSGSTGVACALTGRAFIGIEREPTYFDIACRRIEEAYRQPRLFAEPEQKPVQPSIFDGEAA